MNNYYRYPGYRSFQDDPIDHLLFFGRDIEKELLFHRILSEPLIILFGKSGIGKTSLIHAGVMKLLREKGYLPMIIRFNIEKINPLHSLFESIKRYSLNSPFEFNFNEKSTTLWDYFHTLEIWTDDDELMYPIIILDQFEEFFTLHEKNQRNIFVSNLASIMSGKAPSEAMINHPNAPDVKIVISMREDYLAELDDLSSLIPDIFQKRIRLLPLNRENARAAIEKPASLINNCLQSKPFTFSSEAINEMLSFLCTQRIRGCIKETNEIESFQLQLLCSFLEKKMIKKEQSNGSTIILSTDLGGVEGMNNMMIHYYEGH